jgi:sarcosine oxidase subunit alpha
MRRSPFHHAHVGLGARFVDRHGWSVPDVYASSADDEARRARATVGLADVSAGGALGIRGDSVEALIPKMAGVAAPPPGRAVRVRLNGAPALVGRLAAEDMLVLTHAADREDVARALTGAADAVGCAHVTDLTSAFAALDLIGPLAPDLLARCSPLDLSPVAAPALHVVQGEVARVRAIVIVLDSPAAPAYRVLVSREHGEFVWTAIVSAGRDLDLVPLGAAARRLVVETGGPGP